MIHISGGVQESDWDFFWRKHAGSAPPGPLPEGALAMLFAGGNGDAPTLMQPQRVSLENDIAKVDWRFTETAPGDGPLSYAILIVPGKELKQSFETVSVPAVVKNITEGAEEKIAVLPVLKLRRRSGFYRL
jgi:hypothetical protein